MSSPAHHEHTQTNRYVLNFKTGMYKRILVESYDDDVRRVQEKGIRWDQLYITMNEYFHERNYVDLIKDLEEPLLIAADGALAIHPQFASSIYFVLGSSYKKLGKYFKAIELYKLVLDIQKNSGNRQRECAARCSLAACYEADGQSKRASTLIIESLEIANQMRDRKIQGVMLGNLAGTYSTVGNYEKAIQMYEKSLAITEEVGDRLHQGLLYGNLGVCYKNLNQYDNAIELFRKAIEIIQEDGNNRESENFIFSGLGKCMMAQGRYDEAINYHTEEWNIAEVYRLPHSQASAAMQLGVAIWARARYDLFNVNTTISAFRESICKANDWLAIAIHIATIHKFHAERNQTVLYLSFLAFDKGDEKFAIECLEKYLSTQVEGARSYCMGCEKRRGTDVTMLTCGDCKVARFCNKDHQKKASKRGDVSHPVRHKDICSLLNKWRDVMKGKATAESCTPDLLAFLRRDVWWRSHAPVAADSGAGARD